MPLLTTALPAFIFPNKLANKAAANIPKRYLFSSFDSFSTVSQIPFISKSAYSIDLTIFMISSISSFENTSVVPERNFFFWIAVFVAKAVSFNPKGTKTVLAHSVSTFFY